jgi:hypothetical protein
MADIGDVLRAAPIGLLMLIGSYLAAKRRQSGAARAAKEYPELASKLGLSLRTSDTGRIGKLSGEYAGYRVFVDPEERPRIVMYFNEAPQVYLRTYEHEKRSPPDTVSFSTQNDTVDRYFKDRYAAPALGRALRERAGEFEALIGPFTGRWAARIAHLSITPERLECALEFGRPPHIPREAVESLLRGAADLVRFIESGAKA